MKLGAVRVATFVNADIAVLMADINKFLNGQAVTGPPAYAADFVAEKQYIETRFAYNGTNYSAMLVYSE